MKKTILASAILLAGAANAAEIYNNEGATLSLNGSIRTNAVMSNESKAKDITFQDSGSRFNIQAGQEIDAGSKAFGKIEVKRYGSADAAEGESEDGLYFNKAYVGIESDAYGTFTIGKLLGFNDSLVKNDYTYDGGQYGHQNNDELGNGTIDQAQYKKALGNATVIVAANDEDTYELGLEYKAAGLTVGFAYDVANDRTRTAGTGSPLVDNSAYIFGARYVMNDLSVGVQYAGSEISGEDYKGYGIGVEYTMGQSRVYSVFDIMDNTDKASVEDKGSEFMVGADYAIAKGVKTYAEFYSTNSEAQGKGSVEKLILGARVYF